MALFGRTGTGKTTLAHYLFNKKLKVVNPISTKSGRLIGGYLDLEDSEDQNIMKIGHTSESCTSFPKYIDYTDENHNIRFYDLPGSLDSRGVNQTVINAAFMKHILENSKSLRIVFVVSV